jgi:release factor glutamine methyltransferase
MAAYYSRSRTIKELNMTISIGEAILHGAQVLRKAGVPEARREAGSLLAHVSGHDRTFLISHVDDSLTEEVLIRFRENIDRRSSGEPLQYITGIQDFFGRQFRVTPDVLIPRPETELLVEAALQLIDSHPAVICDVGTGSGCIAVTLLCERARARAVAVDISAKAIGVARENAVDQSVDDRILFAVSDCFNSLPNGEQIFDLIVSNPPYVSAAALAGLQREVRDHEPLTALTPGPDGLTMIGRLIQEAPNFLKPDGYLILEIGFDQGEAVENLIDPNRWRLIEIRPDLQGIPRIVVLQRVRLN